MYSNFACSVQPARTNYNNLFTKAASGMFQTLTKDALVARLYMIIACALIITLKEPFFLISRIFIIDNEGMRSQIICTQIFT